MGGSTAHRNAAYHGSQSQAWENAEGGYYIERRDRLRENNIKPAEAAEILVQVSTHIRSVTIYYSSGLLRT